MELDLHTLRNADRGEAARWALKQNDWLLICADHDAGHPSQFVADRLLQRGDSVEFVCPICAAEDKRIKGKEVNSSIEDVDAEVAVIALFGVEDPWSFVASLSQRMQWFGDVKAIWPERHQYDERWNSELYDYGIAVVNVNLWVLDLVTLSLFDVFSSNFIFEVSNFILEVLIHRDRRL